MMATATATATATVAPALAITVHGGMVAWRAHRLPVVSGLPDTMAG
jgi:hypothetical protein